MYIVINAADFNVNHVFFQSKVKNTIMDNSDFIRMMYSPPLCSLNGVFIYFRLNIINIDKSFNKYKCKIDDTCEKESILSICEIERNIMNRANIINKTPIYRIADQLNNGFLKIFNDNATKENNEFILKIYGIWENMHDYGLTYKFIKI